MKNLDLILKFIPMKQLIIFVLQMIRLEMLEKTQFLDILFMQITQLLGKNQLIRKLTVIPYQEVENLMKQMILSLSQQKILIVMIGRLIMIRYLKRFQNTQKQVENLNIVKSKETRDKLFLCLIKINNQKKSQLVIKPEEIILRVYFPYM